MKTSLPLHTSAPPLSNKWFSNKQFSLCWKGQEVDDKDGGEGSRNILCDWFSWKTSLTEYGEQLKPAFPYEVLGDFRGHRLLSHCWVSSVIVSLNAGHKFRTDYIICKAHYTMKHRALCSKITNFKMVTAYHLSKQEAFLSAWPSATARVVHSGSQPCIHSLCSIQNLVFAN